MTTTLTAGKIHHVTPGALKPDAAQPRQAFDEAALKALAENIKARGIQQPILVRLGEKKSIIIVDGERRWRAAKLARLSKVPVLLAGGTDEVGRRVDQIAVNQLREDLKPMDLARHLVRLRDEHKLTPNELAARMAKDGMKALSQARVAVLVKLVELPAWAQGMIDVGTMQAEDAAPILEAASYLPAMKQLAQALPKAADWRGRVTAREVSDQVSAAFSRTAIDLTRTQEYYREDAVHFAWNEVCRSCEHLKRIGKHGAYCLDPKGFKEHQEQAKAAGLGPGGKKPAKDKVPTKRQEELQAEAKAEQREASLEDKQRDYLHRWLREKNAEHVGHDVALRDALVRFTALGWPGNYNTPPIGKLQDFAAGGALRTIEDFIAPSGKTATQLETDVAAGAYIAGLLPWPETVTLARRIFGADLPAIWKISDSFLDLLRKAELVAIAEKYATLPEGRRTWAALKGEDLKAAIMASADSIPPPPALVALYAEKIEGESRLEEEESDEPGESED